MNNLCSGTLPSPTRAIQWLPSPLRPTRKKRPQATQRPTQPNDRLHGADDDPQPGFYKTRRALAQTPRLATIYEQSKVRTVRHEIDDPLMGSNLRFSAIYCPKVCGAGLKYGQPLIWQAEHLENFAVLIRWNNRRLNVTRTMPKAQVDGLRNYATKLYAEAFHRGELR